MIQAPFHLRKPLSLLAAVFILSAGIGVQADQILYPDLLALSKPTDSQTGVPREAGRKGLLFHFKFQDGADLDSNVGFPLDLSAATVTLQIGTAPALLCTPGNSPAPNNASFVAVDGLDADGAIDTVKILYNGDFPPNTPIKVSVSGARSAIPAVVQNGDPHVITFTTGNSTPRLPADIELVFDISGSMSLPANPSNPSGASRMDALKAASQGVIHILSDYAWVGDKVGVVYFNSSASAFPTSMPNLISVQDTAGVNSIANNIQSQVPTTSTSIGAGLLLANTAGFAADSGAGHNNIVILFSDGEQNTPPTVAVSGSTITVNGTTYAADSICPIVTGEMSSPGFTLQQNIAVAKFGGQYSYASDTSSLMSGFANALETLLVGDKLESVLDVSDKIAAKTKIHHKFPANRDDVALSVLLSWSGPTNSLSISNLMALRLFAPDGTEVDLTHRLKSDAGMCFATVQFPVFQNGTKISNQGEWTIELNTLEGRFESLDYHLIVMIDNPTIASDFRFMATDIGTGENIPVQASLKDGKTPLLNATVTADLAGPDNGLGNLLSTLAMPSGSANPGGNDVVRSAAEAKLLLLLNDPATAGLFGNQSLPFAQLLDNGLAANGDGTANDGIYSALFRGASKEGHYQFLVTARGSTPGQGNFQRTRLMTVFVRPKADASKTDFKLVSSTVQADGSVIAQLSATPKDALGNYLGPDYLGNLDVRSTAGTVSSALNDNLDGSYGISFSLPSISSDPIFTLTVMGQDITSKSLSELQRGIYEYAVKVICGQSHGDILSQGSYLTAINVHNPSRKTVVFNQKFATAPPHEKPGPVSGFWQSKLGPDQALEIDCSDILERAHASNTNLLKGFAVIQCETPLDIVAVYTAADSSQQVRALETERVPPRGPKP